MARTVPPYMSPRGSGHWPAPAGAGTGTCWARVLATAVFSRRVGGPSQAAIGAHRRVLLEGAEDEGWLFLAGLTYVVVAAAPDLAPQLRELVRGELDREDDPIGSGALSIAAYLLAI